MKKTKLMLGDNIESLRKLPDNSIDSIVTDPPYGLSAPKNSGKTSQGGFMNKKWDYDVPSVEFWQEVFRVLKPGGHVLSFGGTRTYHRMVVNIEDAGFEIRDQIMWLYGSGFPKSHNIGKAVDKRGGESIGWFGEWLVSWRKENNIPQSKISELFPSKSGGLTGCVSNWELGNNLPTNEQFNLICKTFNLPFSSLEEAERQFIGTKTSGIGKAFGDGNWNTGEYGDADVVNITKGNSPYEGWGTALKPANEPICVARKPLSEKSVAENVLKWGTGGINIDGCRVGNDILTTSGIGSDWQYKSRNGLEQEKQEPHEGRFPANIILECICDEVIKGEKGEKTTKETNINNKEANWFRSAGGDKEERWSFNDKGDIHTNPNCPCYLMDEQSGISKTNHKGNRTDKGVVAGVNGFGRGTEVARCDSGGSSRFFYQAKVSKQERNMGLDGFEVEILSPTIKLLLKTDYNNKNLLWQKEDLKTKPADTDKLHQKDIEEYITKDDYKWNIELFGKVITEQFLMDIKFIIETATNSTTIYQTLNSLIQKNIKKNTQELLGEMASDIRFVENVEKKSTKVIITSQKKDGLNQNVNPVLLEEVWSINIKENKCGHPTLKPVSLMAYLCRLVTPPNGIILDPFMGSGSTGIAAQLEGFRFVGMEMDSDYFKIAEARIENYEKYRKFIK